MSRVCVVGRPCGAISLIFLAMVLVVVSLSACGKDPTKPATGACCFSNGSCQIKTASDCSDMSGVYKGDGAVCDPNPCTQPQGACCAPAGTCTITEQAACSGGNIWVGANTVCVPNPCPRPGACCAPTGTCTLVKESACPTGSTWKGADTVCDPNPCEIGVCCAPAGTCTVTTQATCPSPSTWHPEWSGCSPNPCPPPGACCAPAGTCTVTAQDACTGGGIWKGAGTTCAPGVCDQPDSSAACCAPDGNCTVTTEAQCSFPSAWHAEWSTCSPNNPCPQQLPAPAFDPSPDTTRTQPVEVAIGCSVPGADIRYTADGSDPDEQSPLYLNRILVSRTTTICARAYNDGWQPSPKACVTYTLTCAAPIFSPPAGAYPAAQWIKIRPQSPGVTIHYTDDGTTPGASSPPFPDSIYVTSSLTLNAIAMREGWTSSPVVTAEYVIMQTLSAPTFDKPEGVYNDALSVRIECATSDTDIRYTTNGSGPDSSSNRYTSPIPVDSTTTILARAYKVGANPSPVSQATYTLACSTPTFDPPGPDFGTPIQVEIISSRGATIYFTRSGSAPTEADSLYTKPLVVAVSDTIKAIAMRQGWTTSAVATAAYIQLQVPKPTFSHECGVYQDSICVTIRCDDPAAVIRYTVNGSPPNYRSPRYESPVCISENTTLRAGAFREDWAPSEIETCDYTMGLFYDFETYDGNFFPQSGWEWGVPQQINDTHSGVKCWAMVLSGSYAHAAQYTLRTPSWHLKAGSVLSFYHRYYLNLAWQCWDGLIARDTGDLWVSSDDGATWTKLISRDGSGGFTDTQQSWSYLDYDLSFYHDQDIMIKFDLWANSTDCCTNYSGWFIDDMQITHASENKKRRVAD